LAASRWRQCALVDSARTRHRNYVRLLTRDEAGVIGKIGTAFGVAGVSIQSIVQYEASGSSATSGAGSGAEIVVITHEVEESRFRQALAAITALPEVQTVAACLRTL
jgi:homoserine dehydrogenase